MPSYDAFVFRVHCLSADKKTQAFRISASRTLAYDAVWYTFAGVVGTPTAPHRWCCRAVLRFRCKSVRRILANTHAPASILCNQWRCYYIPRCPPPPQSIPGTQFVRTFAFYLSVLGMEKQYVPTNGASDEADYYWVVFVCRAPTNQTPNCAFGDCGVECDGSGGGGGDTSALLAAAAFGPLSAAAAHPARICASSLGTAKLYCFKCGH